MSNEKIKTTAEKCEFREISNSLGLLCTHTKNKTIFCEEEYCPLFLKFGDLYLEIMSNYMLRKEMNINIKESD